MKKTEEELIFSDSGRWLDEQTSDGQLWSLSLKIRIEQQQQNKQINKP